MGMIDNYRRSVGKAYVSRRNWSRTGFGIMVKKGVFSVCIEDGMTKREAELKLKCNLNN